MTLPRVPLPALIEAQVARTPERIALKFKDTAISYVEMNMRANQLAHYLIAKGVAPEDLVALAIPRSLDMVVAVLAVLKAGAAYVPIDLEHPAGRIATIVDNASPAALLTTSDTGPRLPTMEPRIARLRLDEPETAETIRRHPATNPTDDDRAGFLSLRNPAYVIYTSGSTGTPKGVVVEHGSVIDYLTWTVRTYPGVRGISLLPTSLGFDLTVTGLYTTLVAGGCVQLVALPGYDPADLAELRRSPCTFLKITPSHLPVLTSLPAELSPEGGLLIGGEALYGTAIEEWRRRHPGATVFNVYGPTEATVNCAEFRIEPGAQIDAGSVPIGRPQAGRRLHVLDPDMRPVPPWGTGELYIGGAGLARGYLGLPGLTADRFLPDPSGPAGARMYRTGDLVRRLEDGNLVFAGRVDDQVKLRGFRIELGEVEAVLAGRADVGQVACAVRGEPAAEAQLIAYVVPRAGHVVDAPALRRYIGRMLPSYMVPSAVVVLDKLPRTPHGKLARSALPDPRAVVALPAGDRCAGKPAFAVVLPLQPSGTRPPLFCVHPAAGVSWGYRELLKFLTPHRPVYGLQAPWLGSPPARPQTISQAVAAYLGHLRKVQPAGPYNLLGTSFGGLVAHTVAIRLQAAGERVALLSILDAYPNTGTVPDGEQPPDEPSLPGLAAAVGGGRLPPPPRDRLPGTSRIDDVLALTGVSTDCVRLMATFTPELYDGDLLFFAARCGPGPESWEPYVTGQVEAHRVPCRRGQMMQPGSLAAIGPILAAKLDEADRA